MNEDGISAMKCISTVNSDEFLDFIERDLLPTLMPFDGINPNSIAILDNCSVHHVPGVVSMITEIGALVHFLPPYSPDVNPLGVLLKGQSQLKNMETYQVTSKHLLAAFSCVTSEDCKQSVQQLITNSQLPPITYILQSSQILNISAYILYSFSVGLVKVCIVNVKHFFFARCIQNIVFKQLLNETKLLQILHP